MNDSSFAPPTTTACSDSPATTHEAGSQEWWSLRLMIVLLFAQVWRDFGGFTFRLDDLIALLMIVWWLFSSFRAGYFYYYRNRLNKPLLFWTAALSLGIGISLFHPLNGVEKQNAVVNGVRLLLAFGLFFAVYNHPLAVTRKIRIVFTTLIGFSLITTTVALLQIAHWQGWLPFSLPAVLTTFAEGADTERGREIFALFLGNTGTHTWSAMLAMQALAVWLVALGYRKWTYRLIGLSYFFVLGFILVRTSVRTSILGLGVVLFVILLIQSMRSRFPFNRLAKPLIFLGGAAAVLAILVVVAPQSYFLERIGQTIPQITGEGLVINRASNIFGRLEYAANALRIYQEFPIAGGGFGSYQFMSGAIGTISVVHAHNSYVQTLAELGTVGGLALLWLMWAIVRCLMDGPPRNRTAKVKVQLWYFTIGSIVFIAFSAFFINAFWEPNQVAFRMILLGVLAHVQRESWT